MGHLQSEDHILVHKERKTYLNLVRSDLLFGRTEHHYLVA